MPEAGPDPHAVGARIAQRRKELGLGQAELAARAGFSRRSLVEYENGRTIPYMHFDALERELGRSREWLLYGGANDGGANQLTIEDRLRRMEAINLRVLGLMEEILTELRRRLHPSAAAAEARSEETSARPRPSAAPPPSDRERRSE